MELNFLQPINEELIQFVSSLSTQHLGSKLVLHTNHEFPDLEKTKIAIIGVLENRGDNLAYQEVDLTELRKELYSLFPGNWEFTIADFGDILPGNTPEDTYYAVKKITSQLIKQNILPIIIGGSQDITYALYRAYDELEQMVNLTVIDKTFDFGKEQEQVTSNSYLSKIIIEEPNNLFNFCNIGFQTYYNPQEEVDLIDKLYFDAYRLGEISNNIALAEPVFRDSDLVSLDLTAVKSSDSSNNITFTPNGFTGKEICALSRYAGISDKVSMFGIFNHNNSRSESVLIAQIVWYFIEGYHFRSNEYPFGNKEHYIKYIVAIEEEEIIFYKSNKTDRWWIEIPFISGSGNKLKRNTLLPCSYDEYLSACQNEVPERWWKAQRKNIV